MSKNFDDSAQIRWWPWILFSGVIILGVMVICIFFLRWLFPDISARGQFGDSFGVVNALFSGLAFAGVIWALRLQQKELALQREELANTRGEMEKQNAQFGKRVLSVLFFNFWKFLIRNTIQWSIKFILIHYQKYIKERKLLVMQFWKISR